MKSLRKMRVQNGVSQRRLAALAGIAYKSLQLLESGAHDPKLSTLDQVAGALGYPTKGISHSINQLFSLPPDGIVWVAERIAKAGEPSWKTWLYNFVDAFRRTDDPQTYIVPPPIAPMSPRIAALLASTVEVLCAERGMHPPEWCRGIPPLGDPWFVAEIDNLKAMALAESPVYFRQRNIFVLANFLDRA